MLSRGPRGLVAECRGAVGPRGPWGCRVGLALWALWARRPLSPWAPWGPRAPCTHGPLGPNGPRAPVGPVGSMGQERVGLSQNAQDIYLEGVWRCDEMPPSFRNSVYIFRSVCVFVFSPFVGVGVCSPCISDANLESLWDWFAVGLV